MDTITVIKYNFAGQETWRYHGHLVERGDHYIMLEANFDRETVNFYGLILGTGDTFREVYYDDRWYNVFEIHEKTTNKLKGWYCNIAFPANLQGDVVSYKDLELDLLVFPDGTQVVLDEAQFEQLPLTPEIRLQALNALASLQTYLKKKDLINDSLFP